MFTFASRSPLTAVVYCRLFWFQNSFSVCIWREIVFSEIDDEMSDERVPVNLHRFALFSCRVYTHRSQHTDLMLTKGPIMYELKNKHILTSCDLSNTILKGRVSYRRPTFPINSTFHFDWAFFSETAIQHHASSGNVRINVYFSYKKKTKDIYYFVKIADHMVALGKFDKHFVVNERFELNFLVFVSLKKTTLDFSFATDKARIQLH